MNLKAFFFLNYINLFIYVRRRGTVSTVNVWESVLSWVLVIELRLSGLAAKALISPALKCEV